MALAHLLDAGATLPALAARVSPAQFATVRRMVARRFNTPPTSSAGRLFDAVASLAGVRDRVSYEGQAAVELEWLATGVAADGPYPFLVTRPPGGGTEAPLEIDTRPLVGAAAEEARRGAPAAALARRFHATVVEVIAEVCGRIRQETGLGDVALSGGVFLNALLTREVAARLGRDGFRVYRHRRVPPGDGGLSLGQLAVAAASLGRRKEPTDVPGDPRQGGLDLPRA
jgi:hydrogenase maturation protein HypF